MIWILNALVLGLLLGILFFEHIERSSLQLVFQSVVYDEPGQPRMRVWGVQIKSEAYA